MRSKFTFYCGWFYRRLVVLTICIGLFLTPISVFAVFQDVLEESEYFEAVNFLETKGVLKPRENFLPLRLMDRAAFFKLAFNFAGYKPKEGEYLTRYLDVSKDSWFAPYAQKAYDLHLLQYNPDDPYFYPSNPVTRGEALGVLLYLFGMADPQVVSPKGFICKDISAENPQANLFLTAYRLGLFDGMEKGRCLPALRMTRGEIAQLIFDLNQGGGVSSVDAGPSSPVGTDEGPAISLYFDADDQFVDDAELFLKNDKFRIFLNVWSRIQNDYVEKTLLEDDQLVYGAIGGLVKTLNDPHSEFQEPDLARDFDDSLNSEFQGIGATVDMIDNRVIIVAPLKGSPAELAGIRPNDIVLEVDGKDVFGLTLGEVVRMIKGPEGTEVVLTIKRGEKVMEIKIARGLIEVPFVESELKETNIAYIRIGVFGDRTHEKFIKAMKGMEKVEIEGLIIDLRNNPGGYLEGAVQILEHFIVKGELIAKIIMGNGSSEKYFSGIEPEYGDYKIVVLMNEGTASASEILAGTLRDYGLAKLVGTRSFGKGSVQQIVAFPDGSQLKLSIAKWYTGKGTSIDKRGLFPDFEVKEANGSEDLQLRKAVEVLRNWE